MLKIVHILGENKICKDDYTALTKIARGDDIKQYLSYQQKYHYDIYLKIYCHMPHTLTLDQFTKKYLDKTS